MKGEGYILIVEDSHTQAKQLEAILKQLGYHISIAYSGQEALSILEKQKPVIVISDILMPEMDGYQFCKLIKSNDNLKDIAVILLTQLSDPKEIIRGLECGADDFIVKPYNEEFLLARIHTTLALKTKQDIASKLVSILIVEDSPTQAEQLKYLLEEKGYAVMVAADGKEGLAVAKKFKPTIIISDIVMPVMDGYEFAQKIKTDKELHNTPIILITALTDRKDASRKASVVADGYFTKPYDDKYLLSKIEALLTFSMQSEEMYSKGLEVKFAGDRYVINSGRRQILNFLLSTYENAVQQNSDLILMHRELQLLNEQLEERVIERTKQLRASEANFRALADNASDGIVINVGSDGNVVYANKRIEDMTGFAVDELLNISIKDYIAPDKFPNDIKLYRQMMEGMPYLNQHETAIVHKNGNVIPAEITASKTLWHNQPAIIVIIRDITERRKRGEELIRTDKLESLSILAGGIAHDFNNLLAGIVGNISVARSLVNTEDKIYTLLTDLEKASLKAKNLTLQLLTFAKGGAPIKQTASIAGFIGDSAAFALSGSNVKCDFSIAEDLWPVEVDAGQMTQVIHNLIINAKQAMHKGGTIKVSAENTTVTAENNLPIKEGKYIKITIQDTGVGISEKHISKIFDPYFTTKEGGSGLGLATSYSIIKNHGGFIAVESTVGIGTTLTVHLPASQKEFMPKKDVEEQLIPGKGRILVMDDEAFVRDVAGRMLTKLGYEVDFARNGAEAIGLYKKLKDSGQPFDAVIIDLTIPGGMGGKETIQKLLEIDPDVKAIVSSGYSDDAIMSDYRKYKFSGVIAKPYRIEELSKTVHQVIVERGE
ncbi:MAG TPA: ATP-binding response regulator, partial [Candidatus Wunengus sp. YC60]|uniref:ATP-binding response regulator n=1 Tax=Candidatus Wunengus sp. YC60 TaxID=3367697 RepID=UPI004024ACCF